jgi:hypothetical protein
MKKDIPLEAIRGVAALVVVVWHTCLGFFPQFISSWQATPLFVFMNGNAAVQLFFVLSGHSVAPHPSSAAWPLMPPNTHKTSRAECPNELLTRYCFDLEKDTSW